MTLGDYFYFTIYYELRKDANYLYLNNLHLDAFDLAKQENSHKTLGNLGYFFSVASHFKSGPFSEFDQYKYLDDFFFFLIGGDWHKIVTESPEIFKSEDLFISKLSGTEFTSEVQLYERGHAKLYSSKSSSVVEKFESLVQQFKRIIIGYLFTLTAVNTLAVKLFHSGIPARLGDKRSNNSLFIKGTSFYISDLELRLFLWFRGLLGFDLVYKSAKAEAICLRFTFAQHAFRLDLSKLSDWLNPVIQTQVIVESTLADSMPTKGYTVPIESFTLAELAKYADSLDE